MTLREEIANIIFKGYANSNKGTIDTLGIAGQILSLIEKSQPKLASKEEIEKIITDDYIKGGTNSRGEHYIYLDRKSLAHALAGKIPAQEKKEWCECEKNEVILCRAMECNLCHKCEKPIKPKGKRIEKLELDSDKTDTLFKHLDYICDIKNKINEIIEGMEEMREGKNG